MDNGRQGQTNLDKVGQWRKNLDQSYPRYRKADKREETETKVDRVEKDGKWWTKQDKQR